MAIESKTLESNVAQVDIDIDDLFWGTAGADSITLPEETKKPKSVFSKLNEAADFSFAQPDADNAEDDNEEDDVEEKKSSAKEVKETADDVFAALDAEDDDEEEDKAETRGRKKISGISDVFSKLIKEDKIVPFDDEKSLDEYTAKDWEELIEANLEERAQQVRRETPKQFFESLPQELQVAARYVADGGTDLKGLFSTLAQAE